MTETTTTCPNHPGAPLHPDCPGAEACAQRQGGRIERADAELARRKAAGEPVERWGTSAADFAGVQDNDPLVTRPILDPQGRATGHFLEPLHDGEFARAFAEAGGQWATAPAVPPSDPPTFTGAGNTRVPEGEPLEDLMPRPEGCLCHLEEGDSPCPVHDQETACEETPTDSAGGSGPSPMDLPTPGATAPTAEPSAAPDCTPTPASASRTAPAAPAARASSQADLPWSDPPETSLSWSFSVPGIPMPKARPRFTRTGHTFTPKPTVDFEARVRGAAIEAGVVQLQRAVAVSILFVIPSKRPSKKGRNVAFRPDLDNLGKAVLDALNAKRRKGKVVSPGVAWVDDVQVSTLTIAKRIAKTPDDCRTAVTISPDLCVQGFTAPERKG